MTYSAGYSDDSDTTSDVSIENEYNVVEVNITDDSYSVSENINTDYTYNNTYLGEVLESEYVLSERSVSSSSQPDVNLGGYNPSVINAVDFYECQEGYGKVDLQEIADLIEGALQFGVSEYDPRRVNVDYKGDLIPQFGYDCVNIPINGGWDYVDYTVYSNFQGSYGENVIPIRTTPFGPPRLRSNIDYSNGRTNKGVPQFGVIKADKEIDFNLVKPDGGGVLNDINKDTIWQSGPRVGSSNLTKNKQAAHPTGGAGAPMTPGVAFDPNSYSARNREKYYEYYSAINAEQVFDTETRYDYQPTRELIYVNHLREDTSDTTPDFGVMGVSGWLYGLQTKLTGSVSQVMSGYTPQYNHSGMAINYVYGVYKKDKSDEELDYFEEDLKAYIEYVQDIIDEITAEEEQTNSYNAQFSNEPYSEHRLKPDYLGRFIEGGLLERQRRNILKDSEANHMLLQFTFEFICSKLPINEGKLPHEQEFPITSDRLNHQLAANGELAMETFLDYLFCVFSNIPDHVIATLGYIPKLSDLANFVHHEVEPTDPVYFRYYLYNFILWACRPTMEKRVKKFSIEKEASSISSGIVLPSPTIWFEDDSYITLDEWLNYETGGFEQMCGRMDGEIRPVVVTLEDGSEGYNEVECLENTVVTFDEPVESEFVEAPKEPRVLMTLTENSFIALSGPITKLQEGEELPNSNVSRTDGVFYDMLKHRKDTMRNIYRSWARSDLDEISYEIPSEFRDGAAGALVTRKASNGIDSRFQGDVSDKPKFGFADPETQAPFMNQWIREEMVCWWQENISAPPDWAFHDNADSQNLTNGTYEFHPWVPKSDKPHDVEMVSHYIWINYDDLVDANGNPAQKPHFAFWFGDSKSGRRNAAGTGPWQTGGARIRLTSKIVSDPDDNTKKFYQIEVPSSQKASRDSRFFRIGAFFPKSKTNMTNDPKVMGKKDDWKLGKKFKFEIRPAKKVENDIGKDPNKGPVYHAKRGANKTLLKQGEPLWYDEYWKNPRNYIKDGQMPLNMNKWYELRWNTSYVADKVKPNVRFWWGKNKDSITPMEIDKSERDGMYFSTAQVLYKEDNKPYVFKPKSKYLYFGGMDSGRNMDQWSKDGEPWVVAQRRETPPKIGPSFYADYRDTLYHGDVQNHLIHWEEETQVMPSDSMSQNTYTILIKKFGYWQYNPNGVPVEDLNLPIKMPIIDENTKTTRIWRFRKDAPFASRDSHRMQYLSNRAMSAAKWVGKTATNLYKPEAESARDDYHITAMKHTNAPGIPRQLGETIDVNAVILHDSSNLIQFGRYECQPAKVEGSGNNKVARKLENWSRLGEPEQLTCVPLLSPTGCMYWALSTDNADYMNPTYDPAVVEERVNNISAFTQIGNIPGVVNPFHRHWPGPEAATILQNLNRFNTNNAAFNHNFDDTKPKSDENPYEVPIKKGKYYKFKFPSEEEAFRIMDQVWREQHEASKLLTPAGKAHLPGVDDPNLKYQFPKGIKFRVNWVKNSWRVHGDYHDLLAVSPETMQAYINDYVAWEEEIFEPGKEYTIKAKGDAYVFGVVDFDEWRFGSCSYGPQLYKDQETYDTTKALYGVENNPKSMFNWSPYGLHFPHWVESAEKNHGPEYYANYNSFIETEIPDQIGSDFRRTLMGEINFAKSDKELDKRKGDWWKMPMTYWTPGKDDHDFHEDMYRDGKAKATKIKAHRMYKVSWMKSGANMHPWDCDFVFVDDAIKADNTKLISRFHYANEQGQYGELLGRELSAFAAPETYYFPDKGGYCKDKDGQVIRLQKQTVSGHVLLLSTSENLIMGAHNPAQPGEAETPYKTEGGWQKKGEKTHLKIEETTVDYWQDGWAYWAASGHDDQGRANFFSKHWNLPMKHIAPGFIVEGDEYEVVAMPNMSPNIVYHLWWAPAGVEDHFEEIDRNDPSGILQNTLKNSLLKSETTLVAGTTIKVRAKGNRLLLAATNTGRLREDLWNPNAEGAPLKIRRLPVDRDPIGPGYYGTRNASNNGQYGLNNIHWKDIWDWNSWMTFQDETYSQNLDRFVRGRTYRLKRRTKDYSDFACGEGFYSTKVLPSTRSVTFQYVDDTTADDGSFVSGKRTFSLPDFDKYPAMQRWDLGTGPRQRVTFSVHPSSAAKRKYTFLFSNNAKRPVTSDDPDYYFDEIITDVTELTLTNFKSRYVYLCTTDIVDDDDVPGFGDNGVSECFSIICNKPAAGGGAGLDPENQAVPPGGGTIPLGDQYEYEVIGAEDAQALTAGKANSNRFSRYGELSKQSEYLDIKGIPFVEVVFSTINTPMNRTLQDWGPEGEQVFIDTFDYGVPGVDYISGPGYYGRLNGSQFTKPDFCNLHYLSPLNAVKVEAETGYRIRRSQKDPNQFFGTGRVFGVSDEDLTKQHGQNSRFNDYDVTLLPRNSDAYPEWKYFVTNQKTNIIFGVYNRHEKNDITDWSVDGEKFDYQLEKVDVESEEGPLYWANYPQSSPLYRQVDWTSNHWETPVNALKRVTIKKIGGEIVHDTQFDVDQTYLIKHKTKSDYEVHFYENSTGFPTTPTNNNDYNYVGTLKAGLGDNTYLRLKPSRPELFLGASNIPDSDFRSKDHRFWSKRGIPCDLIFEEVNYLEGPGYWADHSQQAATTSKGGPWFSSTNQEGNIPSSFRVQAPVLSNEFWHDPVNYLDGIASNQLYEVKPFGVATYPYTITLWETFDRSSLKPGNNSKMVHWKKISETRRKGTSQSMLVKPSSRYIIVSCQETDVALREEDWSPKGMPIDLQFTRIIEQEGASFYADTNAALKRGQTAWTNKHWKGYTFLGTSTGAPLIASINYKVKVSKSTKNAKYRHSIFARVTNKVSTPMTSTESNATTYKGADVAKGSYGNTYNSAKIKGSGGNWIILSTHKFNKETTPSKKNRTLTNWSPKGEFVELSILALDSNLVPDHGLIGKILGALSALASALLLLLLLFKYVPPTDWLLEFNIDGPKNEVFPSRIPCEDPNNEGELPDNGTTYHGWKWTNYSAVRDQLPPHAFFWTAEPKWMNLYADQMSSLYARVLGLRHHGYFFDVTCYESHTKNYKASGIGFCNLTQTFGFGIIRPSNFRVKRISLADQKGQKSKYTSWGKDNYKSPTTGTYLDSGHLGLTEAEMAERDAHIKEVNAGIQDPDVYEMTLDSGEVWHKNSRRTHFKRRVNPQFFSERIEWSNPEIYRTDGFFSWPRTLNTTGDTVYRRAGINMRDRWFQPAMVRTVDCYFESTIALATKEGLRNLDRTVHNDTKVIKTMKMGENRDKHYSQGAGKDYKSYIGSVKSYETLTWNGDVFPYTSGYGSGTEHLYDSIFSSSGFNCYIYNYWKSNKSSHNHAWIMCTEENTTWPTNSEVEGETEWYIGMKFDLDTMVTDSEMNRQQMVFMGLNFTTDEDQYQYHELYPTKSSDYLFRGNGEVSTAYHLEGQRTKIEMEVWSTRRVRYNSIFSKMYWGFYLFDESGGKPHYFGHNISNLKPLASTGNPRDNLIITIEDWNNWKAEQAAKEQEGT